MPSSILDTMDSMYGKKSNNKRKSINKGLREKVWIKYMGNRVQGKCYCCRIKPIHFTDFEVGHNKSVYSGGTNNINNLRPICRSCNREMGVKSIEWYRNKYYSKPKERTKVKKQPTRKTIKRESIGLFDDVNLNSGFESL